MIICTYSTKIVVIYALKLYTSIQIDKHKHTHTHTNTLTH